MTLQSIYTHRHRGKGLELSSSLKVVKTDKEKNLNTAWHK
jgi:hypothetical protein